MEMCLTVEERLDKQRWYIGEVTQEVAESLLSSNKQPHSFVVFTQPDTRQYILSRFPVGLEDGVIEHLAIHCEGGKWWVTGQTDEYDDVIEAVNCYVLISDPPLMPVVQGNSFVTQISLTKAPPEYDKANRALKPDIAPLPEVRVADKKAVEVQNERYRIDRDVYEGRGPEIRSTPSYSTSTEIPRPFVSCDPVRRDPVRRSSYHERRSTWHRYEEHHRCHPRNVCSGCCHTQEHWNGKAYANAYREWYDPRGSGPLRVFGLILFWLFCAPCYGCYKCCLITAVRFCLCYDTYYGRA